jgi:hypothetical protein
VCTSAEVPLQLEDLINFVNKTEVETGIKIDYSKLSQNWMLDVLTNRDYVDRINDQMDQGVPLFDAVMEDFVRNDLGEPDIDLYNRT